MPKPASSPSVDSPGTTTPRNLRALIGALLVLALVAVAQWRLRVREEGPEAALRGGYEEATSALPAVLARTPEAQRLPLLLSYAADSNPGLRYAAVDALGEQRGAEAAAAIERGFADSASIVRQRALEVLPLLDRERGLRLLLTGLSDEDGWIREAAATQLYMHIGRREVIVDRRAVPLLVRALDDPDPIVPQMAISALRKLTGQPWRYHSHAPAAVKHAVHGQWRQWWEQQRSRWKVPPEYAEVVSIRPARADPAPDFNLRDLDGRPLRLADQQGRVTLLNFWGSWCAPCRQEVADLVKLDGAYRSRGLDIAGIALGEKDAATLRAWCRRHSVSYRQALATEEILTDYGHIHEVPVSVLIDRQSRIRYRWEGERDFDTFRRAVERLLDENPGG